LKSLPAKTRVRVRIDPLISSDTGAAGDEITGLVDRDVKLKGQVVVRAPDKLHGRVLRFEQFLVRKPAGWWRCASIRLSGTAWSNR
jgi:hypothetical protein